MRPTKRFYVYTLAGPDGVFYAGKGKGRRINAHELEARNKCGCRKCRHIRSVWRKGGEIVSTIVFETDNEDEALNYERDLISSVGRGRLLNKTSGGEGRSHRPDGLVSIAQLKKQHRAYIRESIKHLYGAARQYQKYILEVKCEKALERAIKEAEWIEEQVNIQMEIWAEQGLKRTRMDAYAEYGVHPKNRK